MTEPNVPKNAYTDAPELHPNLLVASVQLFGWLFFHPSAWRNCITRIDPNLQPDFCLAELKHAHWRNAELRRLLLIGCIIWSLFIYLIVSSILAFVPQAEIILIAFLRFGLMINLTFNLAFGLVGSLAGGFVLGLVSLGALYMLELVLFHTTFNLVGSLAGSFALGLAYSPMNSVESANSVKTSRRQIRGIIVGITLGGLTLGLVNILLQLTVIFEYNSSLQVFERSEIVTLRYALIIALMFGLAAGLIRNHSVNWANNLTFILTLSGALSLVILVVGYSLGTSAVNLASSANFAGLLGLLYVIAKRLAGPWAGPIAGMLGVNGVFVVVLWQHAGLTSLLIPVSAFLGLIQYLWLPIVLYPFTMTWNLLLYRADQHQSDGRQSVLHWHSAFWDEQQRLPLYGLEDHVVLVAERNPLKGQAAITYLTTSRQRWAAQAAQIELDARRLERCVATKAIGDTHYSLAAGELEGPASALLRSFARVSQDVEAAVQQESIYNQRLALKAVEDRLDGLSRELTRSSERYAVRFQPIADHWRQIIAAQISSLATAAETRQEIDNPYVIAVPLTPQQEIFVGRTDISARIEQLLLDRRRPPLLLYGQRRTGKTSLLNNLGRLLPSTIIPLFVDLQGPVSLANDHAGFIYNLARGMIYSAEKQRNLKFPQLTREELASDPFTYFDEWLDKVEQVLGSNTALLALDEFEALDTALARGRFEETAVLGMLRHLIQHRPRFKVLIAGSHNLDEVQRWASYLINAQVVHLSYLKEGEARQLVEHPVKAFALRYESDASQRVLDLTHCHPFLVQLLCAEIVALKNEQDPSVRRLARLTDVEAAVPEALSHGSLFFADIERNQVDTPGLSLLRFIASHGENSVVARESLQRQFSDDLDQALAFPLKRELIEQVDGGYRFQVELIRRWFVRQEV